MIIGSAFFKNGFIIAVGTTAQLDEVKLLGVVVRAAVFVVAGFLFLF